MTLRRVGLFLGTLGLAANIASGQEVRIRVTPKPVAEGSAAQVKRMEPSQMLRLMLTYEPRHRDELKQFVRELQDPKSPSFHKYLTFDEWKGRYAPTDADVARVHAWAEQHGFKILNHFRNNLATNIEADSKTVEQTFKVQLHHYTHGMRRFFSSDRDPVIPAEFIGILRNVHGLNNYHRVRSVNELPSIAEDDEPIYRPGPYFRHESARRSAAKRDGASGRTGASPSGAGVENAGIVPSISGGFAGLELTDLYSSEAYDLAGLQRFSKCCNPNNNPGSSPVESSIAIIGNNFISINSDANNDLDNFAKKYGFAYNVDLQGHNSPTCCNGEMTLDVETATAMANNFGDFHNTAHIWAYGTGGTTIGNLLDSWQFAQSDDHARVASSSFGAPESSFDDDTRKDYENVIDAMFAEGWAVSVATGDHGVTQDCSNLSVTFPASNPEIVAVGGTTLSENTVAGKPKFAGEVAWTGPGCNGQPASNPASNNGGGGGGCSSHYDAPPYQTIVTGAKPCNDSNKRALPDIALNAGTGEAYYYNGGWTNFAGTSIASPAFAGFMAQVNSYLLSLGNICGDIPFNSPCAPIGNLNTRIWIMGFLAPIARAIGPSGRTPLYDITVGCNGGDGQTGYCAGTDYDLATGWGSFNMLQLGWSLIDSITHGTVPEVNFSGPATNAWYNNDQHINFTLSSPPPSGTSASVQIAGYTGQWDNAVTDIKNAATPGSGNTFYDGPAKAGTSDFLSLVAAGSQGCHNAHVLGWDNSGRTTDDQTYGPVCYDTTPPTSVCGSADGLWHNVDVSIHCTGADQANLSGLANAADASFNLMTSVPAGTGLANAFTNSHKFCDAAGNCTTAGPICCNMIDKAPPTFKCGSADGLWHAKDVTIPCTAADQPGLSGLANPADASFGVSTSVPPLTETANAFTGTHTVFDVAGNSVIAGPVGGNMVDKKPPSITITNPTATTYIIHQPVASNYGCVDGGSGVATCAGPVANGSAIDTAAVGTKTFTVNATDKVANASSASVNYSVTYKVCLQYDPARAMNGRPANITLQLCDYNNVNVSSKSVTLTATAVDGNPALAKSLGNLNPGNVFLYGPPNTSNATYLYLLDTTGLASGAHVLSFKALGDPIVHSAPFTLK